MAWPLRWDVLPCLRSRGSPEDAQLLAHQIHAGDELGDAVLHLDPGVHLHEVEVLQVAVQQEFHSAGALVVHGPGGPDGGLPIFSRSSGVRAPGGASSMSFWLRRCTEQSRSPRWMTLPWRSARI